MQCVYTTGNRNEQRSLARTLAKSRLLRTHQKACLEKKSYGGRLMRLVRSAVWIVPVSLLSVFALTVLFHNTPAVSAQTGTSPSSSISSGSGPVAWDFAAVGGGTLNNVGIKHICPPGMCDEHDLTALLPA